MPRKRAMSSAQASRVKVRGHANERDFAGLIGGTVGNPQNNPHKKGDVIDQNGDTHSVKGAQLKWQIFLYGRNRFAHNTAFRSMHLSDIFLACIDAFPPSRAEYVSDKPTYKAKLRPPMRELYAKLSDPEHCRQFLYKSLFNDKVKYLTVKDNQAFHVFLNVDVVGALTSKIGVRNSQARNPNQTSEQKVVFYSQETNTTVGEIEMRNDSKVHYREIKFWMLKAKILDILQKNISPADRWMSGRLVVYGGAINCFAPNHSGSP